MTNNLSSTLARLRGIGVSSAKSIQETQDNQSFKEKDLMKGNNENAQALSNFLKSESVCVPQETQEQKYTLEDLDNFIKSMVRHEDV